MELLVQDSMATMLLTSNLDAGSLQDISFCFFHVTAALTPVGAGVLPSQ